MTIAGKRKCEQRNMNVYELIKIRLETAKVDIFIVIDCNQGLFDIVNKTAQTNQKKK